MKLVQNFGNLGYAIGNIGYTKVVRNKDFEFPYKYGKDVHCVVIVENGSMMYNFFDSEEKVVVNKGQLLYIPQKTPYNATYLEDNTTISIFLFDIPEDKTPDHLKKPVLRKVPKQSQQLYAISGVDIQNPTFIYARIYDLLYILEKPDTSSANKYSKILPAIVDIKKHYFENHKVSYYADMCNMSESNFRKLFREYTGTSPVEYRNLIRIYQVKNMVDSEEFSISEAAYVAGFNNMSFFYEVYNRVFK
ncbi:MAG: helix-turn-helix transcriptional regulator [Clostridia bacterium]|nr:helix-turn-helix transcriptional regulator [Clostridia bacterium]